VAAPGVDIFSTFPNHSYAIGKALEYDYGSGTSMATPFVSGLAALVWATPFGTDNGAVRARIETTADPIPGTGTYWTHGRINACNAVGGNCPYAGAPPTPEPTPPSGGSMYVWDIAWSVRQRVPNYHLEITVTVRWDSDGDGVAEGTDEPVSDATVAMTLTYQDGTAWAFSGTTDLAGQVTFKLVKASPGTYTAQVTDLTHATLTWDSALDVDNPDAFAF
jgi:subtilisin family serine protease